MRVFIGGGRGVGDVGEGRGDIQNSFFNTILNFPVFPCRFSLVSVFPSRFSLLKS